MTERGGRGAPSADERKAWDCMKFIILTGMSGAGKSTAIKMMEDIGFYCVDNLPILLLEKFVELTTLQST